LGVWPKLLQAQALLDDLGDDADEEAGTPSTEANNPSKEAGNPSKEATNPSKDWGDLSSTRRLERVMARVTKVVTTRNRNPNPNPNPNYNPNPKPKPDP